MDFKNYQLSSKKIKWDKIYKKKIQSIETTVDWKTGEVIAKKEKALEYEKNWGFTKYFWLDPWRLLNLNKWDCIILFLILENVDYWNDVFLKDIIRARIWKKSNEQRVRNAFAGLVKQTILIKTDLRGLYKLNPQIAIKGDVKAFRKLMWAY